MAAGFGFSIGDLVALGKLANEIICALSECRGAVADYVSLIELLTSLKTSVDLVAKFVSTLHIAAALHIDHSFLNGILFHAKSCYKLLNQFMIDSRKYTMRLMNGQGTKMQTTFRKLRWSLYNAEDAHKLERRLGTHLEAFDRYMLAINIQAGAHSMERLETKMDQMSLNLTDITRSIKLGQSNTPKQLGYPWEADSASSYVHLNDIIGRSIVLPAVLCRTLQTFQDTLRIMFSDLPGFEDITDGYYEIINESNNLTVFQGHQSHISHRRVWESPLPLGIEPGSRLIMSVMKVDTIRAPKDSLVSSIQRQERCPTCGFMVLGRRMRICANCNLQFRKTVMESDGQSCFGSKIESPEEDINDFDNWEAVLVPQERKNISPFIAGGMNESVTGKPAVVFKEELSLESAKMESKYIKRVHYVTELIVPIRSCTNYFHNSRLPIFQAIGQGDYLWVKSLLKNTDIDPDCRNLQGWTALQQACSMKAGTSTSKYQKEIVQLLVAYGADVNALPGDYYGYTALQTACEEGSEEIVDILLKAGANVNADVGPLSGRSALACASFGGHYSLVKKLLSLGANVNQRGSEDLGHSALSAAAQYGHMDIFDCLIDNGFEVHAEAGQLALEKAVFWDQVEVVTRLINLGVSVIREVNQSAPIHAARSLRMVEILIEYGADINAPCTRARGSTVLQHTAQYGDLTMMVELLRLKADVNYQGPRTRGRTSLQSVAARNFGAIEFLRLLVEHGADVNEPRSEEEGYTSLEAACHQAVQHQPEIEQIEFLLKRGARVTTFTLHVAAAWNHDTLIWLLLHHGGTAEDLQKPSEIPIVQTVWGDYRKFGKTVFDTARINDHGELADNLAIWHESR